MSAAKPLSYDAIVLGAGAAGLFCAARIGQAGQRVLVLDHAAKPAEKVRISGGGRSPTLFEHKQASGRCCAEYA